MSGPSRRAVLGAAGAAGALGALGALGGCDRDGADRWQARWVGASSERGHLLRDGRVAGGETPIVASSPASASAATSSSATAAADGAASTTAMPSSAASSAGPRAPARTRRVGAIVVGAGVAGLGAARELVRAGVDDVHVLELEDVAGGNSRGHAIGGMRCPLGAHYLPAPGPHAIEVIELLEALGVRRLEHGRAVYDERFLCHTPQERLFIHGGWRDGLLPPLEALPADERASTAAAYRAFAARVAALDGLAEAGAAERRRPASSTRPSASASAPTAAAFAIPTARAARSPAVDALDRTTFAAWLDAEGLAAPALRWYLDYCCRDDYGAGSAQVSAWAGLHYFASRHGFHPPGDDAPGAGEGSEPVLTWPEGNAWLTERMAAPLADRLHGGRVVVRVEEGRHEVAVDAIVAASGERERWIAPQVVVATPLFVAARVVADAVPALGQVARSLRYAPWLVANLHLDAALDDRPGAPPSWDNVVYGGHALGYVDAMHQSMRPHAGPTVLTAYWALGGDSPGELDGARRRLLDDGPTAWARRVVAELSAPHPDLAGRIGRVDLMRYGHAMRIPLPGAHTDEAAAALAAPQRRVHFAHADLSAYSIFEEALYHGARAGRAAAAHRHDRPLHAFP